MTSLSSPRSASAPSRRLHARQHAAQHHLSAYRRRCAQRRLRAPAGAGAQEDADGGDAYANRLITLTGMVLLMLSVASVLLAPLIVDLYTPVEYPARNAAVAVAFARFFLPQIFFYGLYTMFSQVLNSRQHFAARCSRRSPTTSS